MKKLLFTLMIAAVTLMGFSTANAEVADPDSSSWWNDIVMQIPAAKIGSIGLDADENDMIIADAEGITWDVAGSLTLVSWQGFEGDVGVSKAGVGFVAITRDLFTLKDIKGVSVPGSEYVKVNAGVFMGRDFDGKAGGINTDDGNLIFGAIVNFLGF